MFEMISTLAFGALTALFLRGGYKTRTYDVKGLKLGNDKGSFLKLYYSPYIRVLNKTDREDIHLAFRVLYPAVIGFLLWAIGIKVSFWIIPFGSLMGEAFFLYKNFGKDGALAEAKRILNSKSS